MSHAQQVFDKVVTHLLTQNERSVLGEKCAYRVHKDGKTLKCAVGCLINSRFYNSLLEGHRAHKPEIIKVLKASGIEVETQIGDTDTLLSLLSNLQAIHDRFMPEGWPTKLKELAEWYGLEYNPPSQAETHNA